MLYLNRRLSFKGLTSQAQRKARPLQRLAIFLPMFCGLTTGQMEQRPMGLTFIYPFELASTSRYVGLSAR
jgi:hypothetical protein